MMSDLGPQRTNPPIAPSTATSRFGSRWAWLLTIGVPLLLVALGWRLAPPMLNPDSAMGFYAWDAHAAGGPWNCYRQPDANDISRDTHVFLTWWSPGQYELPGLLRHLGFSWGHVILLSCLIGTWIQAIGCWRAARIFGAAPSAAAWFAAVSTLQWHTLFSFGHFRGGDVVLLAATPWMLIWTWHVRTRPGLYLVGIPALLAGGLYLKLSSLLFTGPLLLAAGLSNTWHLRRRPVLLVAWALASVTLAAGTWLLVDHFFLSRGYAPNAAGANDRALFSPLAFAVISPWLAASGAYSLVGRIWFWLGRDVEEVWAQHGWIVAPVAVALWWFGGRWLGRFLTPAQRLAAGLVLAASVAMFGLLFVRGSSIGLDDRYMRSTATIILLAIALRLDDRSVRNRRLATVFLGGITLFGAVSAAQRSVSLARMNRLGREDFTQQHLTRAAIERLTEFDRTGVPGERLIYVPHAIIGFEIQRQRSLVTDDLSIDREHRWAGRVPELVVAVNDAMEASGQGARIRGRFVDYRAGEWTSSRVEDWWFWTARTAREMHSPQAR